MIADYYSALSDLTKRVLAPITQNEGFQNGNTVIVVPPKNPVVRVLSWIMALLFFALMVFLFLYPFFLLFKCSALNNFIRVLFLIAFFAFPGLAQLVFLGVYYFSSACKVPPMRYSY
jgi:hypothetical protein